MCNGVECFHLVGILLGNFQDSIQPVIRLLPLTAMCDGMRAVMIDGAGFVGILWPLAILALWGVPAFLVGLRYFRWN